MIRNTRQEKFYQYDHILQLLVVGDNAYLTSETTASSLRWRLPTEWVFLHPIIPQGELVKEITLANNRTLKMFKSELPFSYWVSIIFLYVNVAESFFPEEYELIGFSRLDESQQTWKEGLNITKSLDTYHTLQGLLRQ